ncbi:CBS domain-containing protein [Paractinoplanes hotanensis]|uniref:CBS domain-containing protein n=1 Tax=Paractinoplanes hotanensis TaxID=2906497 RepID=A0ABT0XSZ5_9ACTN|nr:CBS domain-containing protein [Actinoplanes hotanensis]MCM4076249.1 CBS domain-containing protein [Actinoplanes hotanensis]
MRAKDVMSRPVHTVEPGAPVEDAAAAMAARAVTALPVVDGAGSLVGIVSEGDLLWQRVPVDPTAQLNRSPAAPAIRPGRVADVMSRSPVTTRPDVDLAEVAETMLMYDVRSMPVLDGDTLVGIVSRRDILRAMVRTDETLVREVQHRLDEYAPGRWTASVHKGVATVVGAFADSTEREIAAVLARTVPGVADVRIEPPR